MAAPVAIAAPAAASSAGSVLGGIASIAAPIIGGLFGKSGQESANRMNMKLAKKQMEFQHEENLLARQFQQYNSDTAYRRAMRDLRMAGLNPILAMKGGASTPGASGAVGARAQVENTMRGVAEAVATASGSVVDYMSKMASLDNVRQDTVVKNQEATLKSTQSNQSQAAAGLAGAQEKYVNEQAKTEAARREGIGYENKTKKLDAEFSENLYDLLGGYVTSGTGKGVFDFARQVLGARLFKR